MSISVVDRKTGKTFTEKVYGEKWLNFFWENVFARQLVASSAVQRIFSKYYGSLQDSPNSQKKIPEFLKQYDISLEPFVVPEGGYKSFNDFFTREYKEENVVFPEKKEDFGSPCEARLSVYEIKNGEASLFIKQQHSSLASLLGGDFKAPQFGFVWVFRLCPVDYHRFHFPDGGKVMNKSEVSGKLFSVNPVSMKVINEVFIQNERHVCEFNSENFSKLFFVDVGAMCVGRIQQFANVGDEVKRGQQKGMFLFGGSTVVMVSEKVKPSPDLLENTQKGLESYVRLGEKIN